MTKFDYEVFPGYPFVYILKTPLRVFVAPYSKQDIGTYKVKIKATANSYPDLIIESNEFDIVIIDSKLPYLNESLKTFSVYLGGGKQ